MRSLLVGQFGENEAEETGLIRLESPAEMGHAARAEGQPPAIAGEPGEFITDFAPCNGPGGVLETANLKDNARRVEKGVGVTAVHLNLCTIIGYTAAALSADNRPTLLFINTAFIIDHRQRRVSLTAAAADNLRLILEWVVSVWSNHISPAVKSVKKAPGYWSWPV